MIKKTAVILSLTVIAFCLCSCRKPENSKNGNNLTPGFIYSVESGNNL